MVSFIVSTHHVQASFGQIPPLRCEEPTSSYMPVTCRLMMTWPVPEGWFNRFGLLQWQMPLQKTQKEGVPTSDFRQSIGGASKLRSTCWSLVWIQRFSFRSGLFVDWPNDPTVSTLNRVTVAKTLGTKYCTSWYKQNKYTITKDLV